MKKKIRFYTISLALFMLMMSSEISHAQRGRSNTRISANYYSKSFNSPIYRNISHSYDYRPSTNYFKRHISYSRIFRLPSNHLRLSYGGNPYYYSNGLFYANRGLFYNLIRPPFGIRLSYLPSGYWSLNYGGYPYYYYSGVFYQNTRDNQYQVVQPPVGATVPSIPKDAKEIVINGQLLYEYLGTYYKQIVDNQGRINYVVQGKDGVLNTDPQQEVTLDNANVTNSATSTNYSPNIGDVVLQLPSQYKIVVINDKKLYVTPENIYYEEFIENGTLKYKVVGK
jgi:hypothetical protein